MKRTSLYILFLWLVMYTSAQESMGIKPDNFIPTVTARLNPSALAAQKPWIHVHLAGFELYARNNLVYLPNAAITDLGTDVEYAYNTKPGKYGAYLNSEGFGPMVSAVFGKHSVGFHTAVRTFASAKNIPQDLGPWLNDNDQLNTTILNVRNARMEATGWGEIGLTYATILKQEGSTMVTGGATLKRLLGYFNEGMIVHSALVELDTNEVNFFDLNGSYSYTEPATDAGRGWGADLGVTYFKLKNEMGHYIPHSARGGCVDHHYEYKIGVSLVDFGYIHFKNGAEKGNFNETMTEDELNEITEQNSDVLTSEKQTVFKASLPSAVSAQFDYNFNDQFYFNGTIIQKISMPRLVGSERDNLLSAALRFEKRWFGCSIPISLQNYRYPQVGLSMRAGPFYFGSDHVIPFIKKSDISAVDAYFGVQFALMKHPSCKQKGKNKKATYKGGGQTMPPCPKW